MSCQIKELLLADGGSPFAAWFGSLEAVAARATGPTLSGSVEVNMALTRDFKETVAARVHSDPAFAQALLDEAITLFVNGEPASAKLILRDLVNATVGFEALAEEIHKPAKSLHRMLSQSGNPTMSNISAVFAAIKRALKVEVHTQVVVA
jgi:DNA-binding phage protein